MNAFLLDTGPVIALLDRRDSMHQFVVRRIAKLSGWLLTTGPVLTEAMFLLQDVREGPEQLVRFCQESQVVIEEVFDPVSFTAASLLMRKYADVPMDFADASLVVAAGRLSLGEILTLDERGFRAYRYAGNKSFKLVLQEAEP